MDERKVGERREPGQIYCADQAGIRAALLEFAEGGYLPEHFADAVCKCSGRLFRLTLDDTQGVAVRTCVSCSEEHPIGDSADFLDGADLDECACPCGSEIFEVTIGVALYRESEAVRWLYVGTRCRDCGLAACYGDWKNEYEDYRSLLANV